MITQTFVTNFNMKTKDRMKTVMMTFFCLIYTLLDREKETKNFIACFSSL